MTREVDVKALISHLVRGDGSDKCRICLGDTTEGQVYLGDTVMMDGERPVTLAELLEVITGIEVHEDDELPNGLCSTCSGSAVDAAHFSILCRKSSNQWDKIIQLVYNLPLNLLEADTSKPVYAVIVEDEMIIINDDLTQKKDISESFSKSTARTIQNIHNPNAKSLGKRSVNRKEVNKDIKYSKLQVKNKAKTKRRQITMNVHNCQCPTCGKEFKYAHLLATHLKQSCDYQRACHICAKVMFRDELFSHLNMEHNLDTINCKKCPAFFFNHSEYVKHMKIAHVKGLCTCGDCGRSFQSLFGFQAHQNVHLAKTCPSCDRVFRNQPCYIYHSKVCCNLNKSVGLHYTKNKVTVEVRNQKSQKKIRVGFRGSASNECICDYCNKKFFGKKLIRAHIQNVHMTTTHRPCQYCGKFLPAANMTEHIKNHVLVRTYKCEHCNLTLKTRLGFIQHYRLHTGERPYACKHCGETFSASSRRSEHIRKVHSTNKALNHACDMCSARFSLPYHLKRHMSSAHDKDDKVTYKCQKCQIVFRSCRGLIHHSRKHQKDVIQEPKKRYVKLNFHSFNKQ